jgi:hypothetical protein
MLARVAVLGLSLLLAASVTLAVIEASAASGVSRSLIFNFGGIVASAAGLLAVFSLEHRRRVLVANEYSDAWREYVGLQHVDSILVPAKSVTSLHEDLQEIEVPYALRVAARHAFDPLDEDYFKFDDDYREILRDLAELLEARGEDSIAQFLRRIVVRSEEEERKRNLLIDDITETVDAFRRQGEFVRAQVLEAALFRHLFLIAPGGSMQERAMQDAARREQATRDYVRQVTSSGGSTADELAKLVQLRDSGVITSEQFEAQKAKIPGMPERG